MTVHISKEWWVTLCTVKGAVEHCQLGEWLGRNRKAVVEGVAQEQRPVALASSLVGAQEAGRIVKRQIKAAREREED